jgi:hypothetical protein
MPRAGLGSGDPAVQQARFLAAAFVEVLAQLSAPDLSEDKAALAGFVQQHYDLLFAQERENRRRLSLVSLVQLQADLARADDALHAGASHITAPLASVAERAAIVIRVFGISWPLESLKLLPANVERAILAWQLAHASSPVATRRAAHWRALKTAIGDFDPRCPSPNALSMAWERATGGAGKKEASPAKT